MARAPVVIAVGSQKGGCGKTTTSVNLAAMAAERGFKSAVLDLDPQGSALIWGKVRDSDNIAVAGAQYMYLGDLIETAAEHKTDLVILDIPPKASDAALAGFKHADLVLIPVVPELYDMGALEQAVELAQVKQKAPYIFINKAPQVGSDTRDAIAWIESKGWNVAPVFVENRKPIAQAQALGLGTEEFLIRLKEQGEARSHHINAANQMIALFDWVAETSGLNSRNLKKTA